MQVPLGLAMLMAFLATVHAVPLSSTSTTNMRIRLPDSDIIDVATVNDHVRAVARSPDPDSERRKYHSPFYWPRPKPKPPVKEVIERDEPSIFDLLRDPEDEDEDEEKHQHHRHHHHHPSSSKEDAASTEDDEHDEDKDEAEDLPSVARRSPEGTKENPTFMGCNATSFWSWMHDILMTEVC